MDKTEVIHRLVDSGKYYFLSRPRRFGKSLLVDILHELFSGSRELFEGLWIQAPWDWEQKSPVIHFNFADMGVRPEGMEMTIRRGLAANAEKLGLQLGDASYDQQLKELITNTSATLDPATIPSPTPPKLNRTIPQLPRSSARSAPSNTSAQTTPSHTSTPRLPGSPPRRSTFLPALHAVPCRHPGRPPCRCYSRRPHTPPSRSG